MAAEEGKPVFITTIEGVNGCTTITFSDEHEARCFLAAYNCLMDGSLFYTAFKEEYRAAKIKKLHPSQGFTTSVSAVLALAHSKTVPTTSVVDVFLKTAQEWAQEVR